MKGQYLAAPHLVGGLMVWAVWFVVLYSGLSVACEFAPPAPEAGAHTWVNYLMAGGGLLVSACLLYGAFHCFRAHSAGESRSVDSPQRFVRLVAGGAYLASAAGVVALTLPVLLLPPCQ